MGPCGQIRAFFSPSPLIIFPLLLSSFFLAIRSFGATRLPFFFQLRLHFWHYSLPFSDHDSLLWHCQSFVFSFFFHKFFPVLLAGYSSRISSSDHYKHCHAEGLGILSLLHQLLSNGFHFFINIYSFFCEEEIFGKGFFREANLQRDKLESNFLYFNHQI